MRARARSRSDLPKRLATPYSVTTYWTSARLVTTPDLATNKKGYIAVGDPETLRTSKKGVFAGGDIVTGAATVILAMGAGRKAARSIDEYLRTGAW